jgi:hypothetical protein
MFILKKLYLGTFLRKELKSLAVARNYLVAWHPWNVPGFLWLPPKKNHGNHQVKVNTS